MYWITFHLMSNIQRITRSNNIDDNLFLFLWNYQSKDVIEITKFVISITSFDFEDYAYLMLKSKAKITLRRCFYITFILRLYTIIALCNNT